jgi:hypothetical protein
MSLVASGLSHVRDLKQPHLAEAVKRLQTVRAARILMSTLSFTRSLKAAH